MTVPLLFQPAKSWRKKRRSHMASTDPAKEFFSSNVSDICPYCAKNIGELSLLGRDNHRQWCYLQHIQPIQLRSGPAQ